MKSIKEKEQLIKMSMALGVEPDPKMVKEVLEYKQMMADIRKKSVDVVDVFEQILKIKQEDFLPKKVEQLLILKSPLLEDLSFLLEEDTVEEIVEPLQLDIPKPPTLEELLEQFKIEEEPVEETPRNKLIDLVSSHITKEVMNEQKAATTFQQPDVPIPQTINELKRKVKMLEEWLTKVSMTGPGSGEVNLLRLDDVDTSNIGDEKVLRYNAANAKIEFATITGGGSGGGGSGGSLSVDSGGTGRATLTANAVLFGAGTGAVGLAAGTSGQVLQIDSDGGIKFDVIDGGTY